MKPPQVAIDFGTASGTPSRTSSDEFEQVPYPADHHSNWDPPAIVSSTYKTEEELPLHYMNEEKARRRVKGPGGGGVDFVGAGAIDPTMAYYDDEGKDVYAKIRPEKGRVSSGRLRRPPPPPPTTIVRAFLFFR